MVSLQELETWLTTGQVARALGRSRPNVIQLAESRRIRSVRTRAGWLYDPNSVADLAADMEDVTRFDEVMASRDPHEKPIPWEAMREHVGSEYEEERSS